MNKYLVTFLAACLAGSGFALEEFSTSTGGLVVKNYPGIESVQVSYEVGKSIITLSKPCLADEHAGDAAILAKQTQIEELVKAEIKALEVSDTPEKLGSDFTAKIIPYSQTPVVESLNPEKKQYFWKNTCTGEETAIKPIVDDVFTATKQISVWYPNKGQLLTQLTKLVKKIEALSDDNVKVKCNSTSGENFDLALTPTTEKEAWAQVKEKAKALAQEAMEADIKAIGGYDKSWEDLSRPVAEREEPGVFMQVEGGNVGLPEPQVVPENREWVANFSSTKPFTVLYKQMDTNRDSSDVLVDSKTYNITTNAKTKKNLYGTLTVTLQKNCFDDKTAAETDLKTLAQEIRQDFSALHKATVGDKKPTETDRVYLKDPVGKPYNPFEKYKQIKDDKPVDYFYNTCNPAEKVELTEMPKREAFSGVAVYKIKSSNLTELSKLRDKYDGKYKAKSNDPKALTGRVKWGATATVSELVALAAKFEVEAVKKFLAPNSEYRCEEGNFSLACLSDMQPRVYFGTPAAAPASAERGINQYSDAADAVDETERGERTLTGTYTITKTWRKVLRGKK